MKSTATDELAIQFALSLARGEPNLEQIALTILADNARELSIRLSKDRVSWFLQQNAEAVHENDACAARVARARCVPGDGRATR
jgi:hypothetical protein